jgi:chromosome segregation protein
MKLTRLELSGFKSFADSVELAFEDGITAIVGPNGCGKSNISDAVRWVLGEQRARLLRSARMDEVIFQGSVKRRPINLAEVTLVFDNEEGLLPVSYQEVAVTRRLSRSAQSDYLLNQSPVRLRDVQDTLRGTGLGSDAGVVIEAQMIDRLLSDNAEERRSLFEEAAGIGLYRDRKASTERRLERTGADLQRLDDLIGEVATQVRSLARQRGKAERHHKFQERRFAIVMTLARHDLASLETRDTDLVRRREELRVRMPEAREAIEQRERQRETRVRERAAAEASRTELERRLAEAKVDVERLEGDLKLAGERLEHATSRRSRAQEERADAQTRATQATRELESAHGERQSAAEARNSVQTELDLRSASEDEARQRLTDQRTRVRDVESQLQQQAEALRALAGERTAVEQDIEELDRQEKAAGARLAEARREHDGGRKALDAARLAYGEREREEREASTGLERARHNLAAAREHEAALRIERREMDEAIAQLGARREALSELERRREGLAPAAQAVLGADADFGEAAVLGPLSDFLTISAERARLAERLLGDWLDAVLVRDQAAVEAVRRWHAEAQPGPLILLPVEPGPQGSAEQHPLQAELEVQPPAARWVSALLAGSRAEDETGAVIRRAGGAIYLPGPDHSGPLSRRAELDQLAEPRGAGHQRRGEPAPA